MIADISDGLAGARLEAVVAYLDTGTGNAKIRIYDGTKVDPPGDAPGAGNHLLAEVTLDKPCGTVTSGVLELTAADIPLVLTSGTATWARFINGNGDWAIDADVSTDAGTGFVRLDSTTLYAGGKLGLISCAMT